MANTYIKAEKRVQLALAELYRRTNFSNLVTRIDGNGFIGAKNDQLWYETKGMTRARDYEWRTRNQPVVWDEVYKTRLPIKLDKHMTSGVKFTDEEEKFDLESYRTEILVPQVEAVADRFDAKVTTALLAADCAVTNLALAATGDANGASALRQALAVKKLCDDAGMPANGRKLVAGANPFAWLAGSSAIVAYDPGQALTVFREGTFGRIAKMDLVDGTQQLGENVFYVVHPSWGVLANAAANVPQSVGWGARMTFEGWSLRVVRQYDINYETDRSLVSTFWGLTEIEDQYARYTDATIGTATDGSEVGDVIIIDGEPQFTGKNARIAKGTFTPA